MAGMLYSPFGLIDLATNDQDITYKNPMNHVGRIYGTFPFEAYFHRVCHVWQSHRRCTVCPASSALFPVCAENSTHSTDTGVGLSTSIKMLENMPIMLFEQFPYNLPIRICYASFFPCSRIRTINPNCSHYSVLTKI